MKLLLVEDEAEIADLVRSALQRAGFVTDWTGSLENAREALSTGSYGIVVLDRQLDDGDGIELVSQVRALQPGASVLVLSALGSSADKVEGLERGADDYLPKPFLARELVARIRALARRPRLSAFESFQLGNLSLDVTHGEVTVAGERLEVTRRELLLLECLMRRSGRTTLRNQIEAFVYGTEESVQLASIEPHVSRLRRRLAAANASVSLHTIRGVGYLLSQNE